MERRNFAALCAAVLCFWLFALAFGTAQGMGLHLVARREAKTASRAGRVGGTCPPGGSGSGTLPQLPRRHPDRAGQRPGAVYEKMPRRKCPSRRLQR